MNIAIESDATRERVLAEVTREGPITASRLATRLGLSAAGVRRHLDALVADGQLEARELTAVGRKGRGRPARGYVVSPLGHSRIGSHYDDVATEALRFLAEQVGPEAVAQFARQRLAAQADKYADVVAAAGPAIKDRIDALAGALAADGFAATSKLVTLGPSGADSTESSATQLGIQLCQGHCPLHQVAEEFPQFCDAELEAFGRILGQHVHRLATLAGGEHVCTTYVSFGPTYLQTPSVRPVPVGAARRPRVADLSERTTP